ncbi:MAG TPA: hypothetical protein VFR66_15215 [Burkholderiales bacterium]|nr:hypothetical protein [Burkholderiales bacterium]
MRLVRPGRAAVWTRDRIEALSTAEVRQLRDNAERLSEAEIVGLCDEILKARPKGGARSSAMKNKRAAAA